MSPKAKAASGESNVVRARRVIVPVVVVTIAWYLTVFLVYTSLSRYFAPMKIRHWNKDCIFAIGSGDGRVSRITIGRPDCLYGDSPEFEVQLKYHDIVLQFPNPDFDLLDARLWMRSPMEAQEWALHEAEFLGARAGIGFVVQGSTPLQIRIHDMSPRSTPVAIRSRPDGKWYGFPLSFEDLNEVFGAPDSDRSFLSF